MHQSCLAGSLLTIAASVASSICLAIVFEQAHMSYASCEEALQCQPGSLQRIEQDHHIVAWVQEYIGVHA